MVRGERDHEKLREAMRLYTDLKKRCTEKMPPPPPEINDEMDRDEYNLLIGDASRDARNGEDQDALTKFDGAGKRFPTLWSGDGKARKIRDDVRCRLLSTRPASP